MNWSKLLITGLVVVLIFALGVVATFAYSSVFLSDVRLSPEPLFSPPDKLSDNEILVSDGGVLILVEGAWVSNYAGTGSMVPLLDDAANGIMVEADCSLLALGDVVSYHDSGGLLVVHRIVGFNGGDFLVSGDNAPEVDTISCDDVAGVLVGVVY